MSGLIIQPGNLPGRFQPESPCVLTTITSPHVGLRGLKDHSSAIPFSPQPSRKPWQLLRVTQQNSSHTTALGRLFGLPFLPRLLPRPEFSLG